MIFKLELEARAAQLEEILEAANAVITEKGGAAAENLGALPAAIAAAGAKLQDLTITENGIYTAADDYEGLGTVTVEVTNGAVAAGIVYDSYDSGGYVIKATVYGDVVEKYAFGYQSELTEVTLPAGLTTVKDNGFTGCAKLELTLPDGVSHIGNSSFSNATGLIMNTLPSQLAYIGHYGFRGCKNLEISELPSKLTNIGNYAFTSCAKITISELPEGLPVVRQESFSYCTSITAMTIPESVTEVAARAFCECSGLASVTFKGTPETVAADVFQNCTNLTVINVPWEEGVVANAPWGATNATINYNYTEG